MLKSWDLNALAAGDEAAKSIGVNVNHSRIFTLSITSLMVASTVCFTGTIGFIGLVAPHITRMFIGGDNRYLLFPHQVLPELSCFLEPIFLREM